MNAAGGVSLWLSDVSVGTMGALTRVSASADLGGTLVRGLDVSIARCDPTDSRRLAWPSATLFTADSNVGGKASVFGDSSAVVGTIAIFQSPSTSGSSVEGNDVAGSAGLVAESETLGLTSSIGLREAVVIGSSSVFEALVCDSA